jgi:hypothetical protein
MDRRRALATGSVLAVGLTMIGATFTATAADAASKPKIKSYVETDTVSFRGFGHQKGWSAGEALTHKAVLSPKFGEEVTGHWSNTYRHQAGRWHYVLAKGATTAYRSDDGGPWKAFSFTPAQLAQTRAQNDPMHIPPLMFKLHVAHHVGKGHWRATGTLNQLKPLINGELPVTTVTFAAHGYKKLTIDLWLDSRGRPTGITATGTARSERVRVTESFTRYDKPITITAPKTTASAITESADTAQPGRPAWPSVPTP